MPPLRAPPDSFKPTNEAVDKELAELEDLMLQNDSDNRPTDVKDTEEQDQDMKDTEE